MIPFLFSAFLSIIDKAFRQNPSFLGQISCGLSMLMYLCSEVFPWKS